jgi:polyphosphate kinase 2 (PPK2 family)
VRAVDDMVVHTSTDIAVWPLVPAHDKRFARITVLETICNALARRLD